MRRITQGLGASLALLLLLAGIPAALVALRGNPIPTQFSFDRAIATITSPDQGQLVMAVLTWVAWLAWAAFAVSVLVEIPAQLRGARAPRLPGLRFPQRGAHVLVAAVLAMLSLGGPAIAQIGSAQASATTAPAATAPAATGSVPAAPHPSSAGPAKTTNSHAQTAASAPTRARHPNATVIVQPGDTLSGIAKRVTGSGANYVPIAAASRATTQPDGRHLTNPNRIYAGWKLTVPGTLIKGTAASATSPAASTEPVPVSKAPATTTTPAPQRVITPPAPVQPATPQAEGTATTPQVAPSTARQNPDVPPSSSGAQRAGGGAAATYGGTPTTTSSATTADVPWAEIAAGTGLAGTAAAGVVVLLNRRRSAQSRRRRPGRRIAMPSSDLAPTELAVRQDADPLAAADLDLAMRTLAAVSHARHQPLPELRAARITPSALELYLVDPIVDLPTPFTDLGEGVWQVTRTGLSGLLDAHDAADTPAPFPCLVTLGLDEEQAWVLINLEQVGALGVTGHDTGHTRSVLAAMTLELIGSEWADDLRVTLVDVLPEVVDAIGSDRVTHSTNLDHALASLEYLADAARTALEDEHQAGVAQARAAGVTPDTWTPHLLVLATEPSPEQRDRIETLLQIFPRLAIAALTIDTEPLSEWVLTVNGDTGSLAPIDIQVTPQRLDPPALEAILQTFRTTEDDDVPGPVWAETMAGEPALSTIAPPAPVIGDEDLDEQSAPEAEPAVVESAVVDLATDDVAPGAHGVVNAVRRHDEDHPGITRLPLPTTGPFIRLLGEVEVQRATGKRPQAPRRATELVAFLALHPSESHEPLDAALWPGQRVTATKRNGPVNQARTWLGTGEDGHPYVSLVIDGGYRLSADTACDWTMLCNLLGDDITQVSTADLRKALTMVEGQPLTVTGGRGTWAWAEVDRQEMIATIADIAHELSTRAITAGDVTIASWAAAKGLTAEPSSELLWRDQLRAAYRSAVPGRIEQVAQQLTDTLEPIAGDLEPETVALLNDLLAPRIAKVS